MAAKLLLAGTEPRCRLHLRRLLAGSRDIEIVGHLRMGDSLQDTIGRCGANMMLADLGFDKPEVIRTVLAARHMNMPVVVLTHDPSLAAPAKIKGVTTLIRPATLEAEMPDRPFGSALRAGLTAAAPRTPAPSSKGTRSFARKRPAVIAIGSSTGGPQALPQVMKRLAGRVKQPIVITQHMPATFTPILAEHLTRHTSITTVEAANGMKLEPGMAYLAPGGRHLLIDNVDDQLVCRLDDGPPENFCKPAVDPMLRSLATALGSQVLVVILTGMGRDGLLGCRLINAMGGTILAQDEATSVVWGMPGAVAQAGLCKAVLPLDQISDGIISAVGLGL